MTQPADRPPPKRRYQPPTVEAIPILPEERLLVPCKTSTGTNPLCLGSPCSVCSAVGS